MSTVVGVLSRLRNHLVHSHAALRKLERRLDKDRLLCGTLTAEKVSNLMTFAAHAVCMHTCVGAIALGCATVATHCPDMAYLCQI